VDMKFQYSPFANVNPGELVKSVNNVHRAETLVHIAEILNDEKYGTSIESAYLTHGSHFNLAREMCLVDGRPLTEVLVSKPSHTSHFHLIFSKDGLKRKPYSGTQIFPGSTTISAKRLTPSVPTEVTFAIDGFDRSTIRSSAIEILDTATGKAISRSAYTLSGHNIPGFPGHTISYEKAGTYNIRYTSSVRNAQTDVKDSQCYTRSFTHTIPRITTVQVCSLTAGRVVNTETGEEVATYSQGATISLDTKENNLTPILRFETPNSGGGLELHQIVLFPPSTEDAPTNFNWVIFPNGQVSLQPPGSCP